MLQKELGIQEQKYVRTRQFLVIAKTKQQTETVKILLRELRIFKKCFSSTCGKKQDG